MAHASRCAFHSQIEIIMFSLEKNLFGKLGAHNDTLCLDTGLNLIIIVIALYWHMAIVQKRAFYSLARHKIRVYELAE